MTEFSFPWGCDPTGDGGSGSFTVDIVQLMNKYLSNPDQTTHGVVYWSHSPFSGLLAATNPGGNTVRIASGIGLVEGWLYENDANVDFDVSGGAANATDLIVLRRSNPGAAPQTVRLALVRGPAAGVATVTQTASVWEIALWQVQLDGSGNFSALVDVREWIGARNVTRLVQATGTLTDDGVTPVHEVRWEGAGVFLDPANDSLLGMGWRVPKEYLSGLTMNSVVVPYLGSGNLRVQTDVWHLKCGETYNILAPDVASGYQTIAVTNNIVACIQSLALPSAVIDDQVFVKFYRDGLSDPLDTASGIWYHGVEFHYLERSMDDI